jgi:hypothetical protein
MIEDKTPQRTSITQLGEFDIDWSLNKKTLKSLKLRL